MNLPEDLTSTSKSGDPSDGDLGRFRTELHLASLAHFKDEYNHLHGRFRDLDNKSQVTAAIAGIFLATISALAQGNARSTFLHEKLLLVTALCLLLLVIAIAILSMRVKAMLRPPSGDFVRDLLVSLEKVADSEGQLHSMRFRYFGEQSTRWSRAVKSLHQATLAKAKHVMFAQWLLVSSILMIAAVTVSSILNP